MVNRVTFVGFSGAIAPISPHLDQALTCSTSCVIFLVLSKWFSQWRQIWDFAHISGFSVPFWVSGFFFWRSSFFRI